MPLPKLFQILGKQIHDAVEASPIRKGEEKSKHYTMRVLDSSTQRQHAIDSQAQFDLANGTHKALDIIDMVPVVETKQRNYGRRQANMMA